MICGEVLPEPIAKISHRMVTERRRQISGITIKHILHYELIIDYLLIGAFRCIRNRVSNLKTVLVKPTFQCKGFMCIMDMAIPIFIMSQVASKFLLPISSVIWQKESMIIKLFFMHNFMLKVHGSLIASLEFVFIFSFCIKCTKLNLKVSLL